MIAQIQLDRPADARHDGAAVSRSCASTRPSCSRSPTPSTRAWSAAAAARGRIEVRALGRRHGGRARAHRLPGRDGRQPRQRGGRGGRRAAHRARRLGARACASCRTSPIAAARTCRRACPSRRSRPRASRAARCAARIASASRFAELDPYRAATHNKGIMNGVDAVVLAPATTGARWRRRRHAYAALPGRYGPLATWRVGADGCARGHDEPARGGRRRRRRDPGPSGAPSSRSRSSAARRRAFLGQVMAARRPRQQPRRAQGAGHRGHPARPHVAARALASRSRPAPPVPRSSCSPHASSRSARSRSSARSNSWPSSATIPAARPDARHLPPSHRKPHTMVAATEPRLYAVPAQAATDDTSDRFAPPDGAPPGPWTVQAGYRWCERMAQTPLRELPGRVEVPAAAAAPARRGDLRVRAHRRRLRRRAALRGPARSGARGVGAPARDLLPPRRAAPGVHRAARHRAPPQHPDWPACVRCSPRSAWI